MGKKWGRTAVIFDDHMGDIERDFEGGAELKDIATKYDVSPPTITNWLIKAGYKHRKKGRYPQAMKDRAVDLSNRGWEPIAIASLFDTKLQHVLAWIGATPSGTGIFSRARAPEMEPGRRRHVTGRRWTEEQKTEVLDLLAAGTFDVDQIYRLTNASRVRQQRIWKKRMGSLPFPHPKEVRDRGDAETGFTQGRLAGLEEAQRLALSGGLGPIPGIVDRGRAIQAGDSEGDQRRSDAEFEEQKRLLDQGELPPGDAG